MLNENQITLLKECVVSKLKTLRRTGKEGDKIVDCNDLHDVLSQIQFEVSKNV